MTALKFILLIVVALFAAKYLDFIPRWVTIPLVCAIWVAAFAWFASAKEKKRLETIRASKPVTTKEEFIGALSHSGYTRRDIDLIYAVLQPYFARLPFHPHPDDDFIKLYRISAEDLEDDLEEMLKQQNLAWPSDDAMMKLNEGRIVNATYLLDFLSLARQEIKTHVSERS